MSTYSSYPLRTLDDIRRFEDEVPLEQRISARSVYDLFADSAAKHGDRAALTMIMTGDISTTNAYSRAGRTPRNASVAKRTGRT